MEVFRRIKKETNDFEVGDKVNIDLQGYGEFTATAHEITNKGTLLIFDDCVCEHCMNKTSTNEGGFEKSELCRWMNTELLRAFPDEIRNRMVADENGNYLTVPTYGQIFGKDYDDEWDQENIVIDQREQLPLMKERRNRIADLDGKWAWYWLQNVIRSSAGFAHVNGDGAAGSGGASVVGGVRPAFILSGKTDWTKVPVDTKVHVRNELGEEWFPRYFAGTSNGKPTVFANGATSFSCQRMRNGEPYTKCYDMIVLAEDIWK